MRGAASLAFCVSMLVAGAAFGQSGGPRLEFEPPALLGCVKMPDRPLAYPSGLAIQKASATIRVKMTFEGADTSPRAEVFYDSAGGAFRDAVLERVEGYRLPCLKPGEAPFAVQQEFVFDPGDSRRVVWSSIRSAQSDRAAAIAGCLVGATEARQYMSRGYDASSTGVVLVRYSFVSATAPPRVDIVYDGGNAGFAQIVRDYASNLRTPCFDAGEPVVALQRFAFRRGGEPLTVLKDAPLASFVKNLSGLDTHRVRFDFTTMACPFDVRIELRQPHLPNGVGEVERSDPNRREFLEWLKLVELDLPAKTRRQVIGDSMTIAVPCGVLDLT